MTFRKILLWFCIGLPVCVAARIFQIVYATEYNTGFLVIGREKIGLAVVIFTTLFCLIMAILSFKAYKNPEKPPKIKLGISVAACIVVVGLFRELFFENMSPSMPAWQVLLLKFTTVLCMAYFVVLAVQGLTDYKMPAIAHITPAVYAILKTIATFVNTSSLAVIYDNVFLLACYCLLMLFFINYGKLYNGIDNEAGFRKILATGFAAATVCITQSLSVILINAFSATPYLHADAGSMWALAGIGIFIIIFICKYFEKTVNEEEHI